MTLYLYNRRNTESKWIGFKKNFLKNVRFSPNFGFTKNRECIQITSILTKLANLGGRGENVIAFEEKTRKHLFSICTYARTHETYNPYHPKKSWIKSRSNRKKKFRQMTRNNQQKQLWWSKRLLDPNSFLKMFKV